MTGTANRYRDLSRRACLALLASAALSCCADCAPFEIDLLPFGGPRAVLVLVVLDGVRREEVTDPTLAPELVRLARSEGCFLGDPGGAMFASGPDYVSLPGYAEILTGSRRAGCTSNECRSPGMRTVLEDFAETPNTWQQEVAFVGSWPELVRVAGRDRLCGAVSVGRTRGYNHRLFRALPDSWRSLQRGRLAGSSPGSGDYRPDRHTAALALDYLREARPQLLVVSLGDADEYAHRGQTDSYRHAIAAADGFVSRLRRQLALFEREGTQTALFVTTDHGRAKDLRDHGADWPESARTWLIAGGTLIGARGSISTQAPASLADVAPTLRALGSVPQGVDRASGRILWELGLQWGPVWPEICCRRIPE